MASVPTFAIMYDIDSGRPENGRWYELWVVDKTPSQHTADISHRLKLSPSSTYAYLQIGHKKLEPGITPQGFLEEMVQKYRVDHRGVNDHMGSMVFHSGIRPKARDLMKAEGFTLI